MKRYGKLAVVLGLALSTIMCGCEKEAKIANEITINVDSTEVSNAEVEEEQENVLEKQKENSTEVPEEVAKIEEEIVIEASDEISTEDADNQLRIIAENKDMWTTELEYADEVYRYAISDLDHNGRYEVIVSNMGGTGLYTYSRFFEVNETQDGLVECTTDFMEGDSQPDIIAEKIDTYVDANGEFHYVFSDVLRNGMTESYENVRELMLRDGEIITKYIASKATIYEGECVTITCNDGDGNTITEEAYETIVDNYFGDCEKVVTNLGWQDVRQLPDEVDGSMDRLETSFIVFSGLE